MDLRQYIALVRKWGLLVIITAALAAGSSYYYSLRIPPTYQTDITLLVGQALQNPNPNGQQFDLANQLASSYATLVTQQPILEATVKAINMAGPWQALYSRVSADAPGGQLLVITVRDTDPHRAMVVANEVARQLILQSPTGARQKQSDEQRAFVTDQLSQLKTQIETAQKSLNELTTQAAIETDSVKLQDLNGRIDALQTKIDGWQKNYANLSSLLNVTSSNILTVLTPAQEQSKPVSPNIPQNVLLGALVGFMLAIGAAFLFEFLDDTIKDTTDVQRVLNLSTLGTITRIPGVKQLSDNLVTLKSPRSPNAEAYRVLRTNLRFSGMKNPAGLLLVTSAAPDEGKTTTAANLAVMLAQAGKRVVLVDTDLRKPSVHKFFGLPNDTGLSNLFLSEDLAREQERAMQGAPVEGLRVMTSGPLPPNPAELLDSKQMGEILERLRANSDLVILDSPPVLAFADASIVASRCSGIVMVIRAGHTRSDAGRRALDALAQTKVKVLGAVLNRVNPRHALGNYYSQYYSVSNQPADQNGREKRPRA